MERSSRCTRPSIVVRIPLDVTGAVGQREYLEGNKTANRVA